MKRLNKRLDEKKPPASTVRVRPGGASQVHAEARDNRDGGPDGTAAEEIDQVVSMLGDMDIEVEAVEEAPLAEEPDKEAESEWVEEKPEVEETERGPGETADPVRMYLQDLS